MKRPKNYEYSITVKWCLPLQRKCDWEGKCHQCETGVMQKGYEEYLESLTTEDYDTLEPTKNLEES